MVVETRETRHSVSWYFVEAGAAFRENKRARREVDSGEKVQTFYEPSS
jgi:hypothetical protein